MNSIGIRRGMTRALGVVVASAMGLGFLSSGPAATTAFAGTAATANSADGYTSVTGDDGHVIFQGFSLYQPYDQDTYAMLTKNASKLKSLGITDIWMPPAYRAFGMSRYMEGYSVADRYDLGEFAKGLSGTTAYGHTSGELNPVGTKYGTSTELKQAISALHDAGLSVEEDLVPNQMMGLDTEENGEATRTDNSGNLFTNNWTTGKASTSQNICYTAYTTASAGSEPGQEKYDTASVLSGYKGLGTWIRKYFNGTSLQGTGASTILKCSYKYYGANDSRNVLPTDSSVDPTNGWLGIAQAAAAGKINTISSTDHSLASTGWYDAKDASTSDKYWVPFEINDPSFRSYVTEQIKNAESTIENATHGGTVKVYQSLIATLPSSGSVTAQWFIDRMADGTVNGSDLNAWLSGASSKSYKSTSDSIPATITGWATTSEEPSDANDNTGVDVDDQFLFSGDGGTRSLTSNFGKNDEFLVGNDIDNSNTTVQEEQQHWVQWLMENYGFDGFRIDAASNVDSDLLKKIAEAVKAEKNNDKKTYTSTLNYIESYSENQSSWENSNGNPQLSYDSALFYTLRNTLGSVSSRQSLSSLETNSLVNRSGSDVSGTSNWSFVQNHDQEKDIINQMMLDSLGITSYTKYDSAAAAKSFATAYDNDATASTGRKEMEQTALDEYWREMNSADKTSSSNGKNYAPYNVVASYAYLLTNRGTVPTIYYGDLYRTDAAYMSTETPYYEGITKILGLRTKYATGTQSVQNLSDSTADAGSDLIASVRSGTDRASGLAVVIGDNPNSTGTVTISMGKEHANQAYVEALGLDGTNGGQTFVTDRNGDLTITLKGESTAQVHGILDVLRPVSTSVVYRSTLDCTQGAIGQLWQQLGAGTSKLGMPTTCEISYAAGSDKYGDGYPAGVYQNFEHGRIYWDSAHRARAVYGAMANKWASLGRLKGLGIPLQSEKDGLKRGGAAQVFQGGQIHWSSASQAHVTKGAIQYYWASQGWENGWLGYPTSDEISVKGGVYQTFQGGTVWWSGKTRTHAVRGGILAKYSKLGSQASVLGFPVKDEKDGLKRGGAAQVFQGGQIHWSSASQAHVTKGAIQSYWASQGWENGWLGYPTSDEISVKGGVYQTFQGGTVWWSSRTGVHGVRGGILARYARQGYQKGRLGFPAGEERTTSFGAEQRFQKGTIRWYR